MDEKKAISIYDKYVDAYINMIKRIGNKSKTFTDQYTKYWDKFGKTK